MKNFKTFLLPAFVMLAGAGSAYATHVNQEVSKVPSQGYVFRPGEDPECIPSGKECDTEGNVTCTANVGMGIEPLYELNGTSCPNTLKERIVK